MSYLTLVGDVRDLITAFLVAEDPDTGAMLAATCKEELARYVRLGGWVSYRMLRANEYIRIGQAFTLEGRSCCRAFYGEDFVTEPVVIPGDPKYALFFKKREKSFDAIGRAGYYKPMWERQRSTKKKEARRQKQRWKKGDYD